MGMFDYVRCEADLPETSVPPPDGEFQTKDTPDQHMTVYTITKDGRLTWRPYEMETVPKEDRPYPDADGLMGMCGMFKRVEMPDEDVPLHGDVFFYTSGGGGGWWEYRARFTDGRLASITLEDFRAPTSAEQTPPEA